MKQRMNTTKRMPGPSVLGAVDFLRSYRKDPLSFFTRAASTYGDAMKLPFGPFTAYFLNHPDGVRRVLQENHKNYGRFQTINRMFMKVSGLNVFTADGDYWLRQRRLLQPGFHRQRIAGLAQRIVEEVVADLPRWEEEARSAQGVEAEAALSRLTLGIAGRTLFSVDIRRDASAFTQGFHQANAHLAYLLAHPLALPEWVPTTRNRRFQQGVRTLRAIVTQLITARRRSGEDPGDLLSMMLEARYEDTGQGLSDEQLRDETMAMLVAGHETTATSLTWCLYLIAQHAPVQERLHEEVDRVLGSRLPTFADLPALSFLRNVVDETLRLYPSAFVLVRECIEDDEVLGYRIPRGALVQICPYTTHRHPTFWPDPERFDPDRWLPENAQGRPRHAYFPFGHGPRQCIGKEFALMEMPLLLACILQRWRLALHPGHKVELRALTSLRMKHGLRLDLEPRAPAPERFPATFAAPPG
jgi:cytochrome P450